MPEDFRITRIWACFMGSEYFDCNANDADCYWSSLVLHEIGHKIVAKHYGCWAEFRADPRGLKFGMGLAFLLGFIFMAPGAVMVAGLVTRRQNGHIAVAGPLVNLALFIIGIPLAAITLGLTDAFNTSGEILVNGALNWKAMLYSSGLIGYRLI